MKKLITVFLTLTMLLGVFTFSCLYVGAETSVVWDGSVAANFESGSGTASDPYKIANGAQLAFLAQKVNAGGSFQTAYYELTADIVLNEGDAAAWAETAPANSYTAIGTWEKAFGGNFNGNGHTITGIYISTDKDGQGLFGVIQGGAVIKNLAVVNSYIKAGNGTDGCTGTIVGQTNRANDGEITIENIYADAIISANGNEIGGILGNISGTSGEYTPGDVAVTNAVFNGTLENTKGYTAGIIGNGRDATVNLTNCANYGTIKANGKNVAGLLVSEGGLCDITDCVSISEVSGSSNVYAIVFFSKSKADSKGARTVTNCYYLDGIAAGGATKRVDEGATITVLNELTTLLGADATVALDGFTKRENDIVVPAGIASFAPNTSSKWLAEYTVTWKNGDEVLATETYYLGQMPEYKGETPAKAEDETYIYNFNGWLPEIKAVTGDITYEADFYRTRKTIGEPEDENDNPTNEDTSVSTETKAPDVTEPPAEEGGCGSVVGGGAIAFVAIVGLGVYAFRKKED